MTGSGLREAIAKYRPAPLAESHQVWLLRQQMQIIGELVELRKAKALAGVDCRGEDLWLKWPGESEWRKTSWETAFQIVRAAKKADQRRKGAA